ncbi:MAG: hypothetical protein IPK83_00945 [Planctomycetes bacterium]|nr:hypothetical protein [Planctomycetota bacterium]
MISAFLVQYAAGCYWAVAATAIKLTDWRYVRLMCIVSCAIALLALSFQMSEIKDVRLAVTHPAILMLATGILCGFVWLFVNASQGERIRNSQRFIAFAAGTACFAATLWLPLSNGSTQASPSNTNTVSAVPVSRQARAAPDPIRLIGSTLLGAGLLGVATTAMLLGHRYLTDTVWPSPR